MSRVSVNVASDAVREPDSRLRAVYLTVDRCQGQCGGRMGVPYWMVHIYGKATRCAASSAGSFPSPEAARTWVAANISERPDLR